MKRSILVLGFFMTGCFASGGGDVAPATSPAEVQEKPKTEEVKEVPIHKDENSKQAAKKETGKKTIEVKERKDIPDRYKWDPSIIFKTYEDWSKEYDAVKAEVPKFRRFSGKLRTIKNIKEALDEYYKFQLRIEKLYFYASRIHDQDLRQARGSEMIQKVEALDTQFGTVSSYFEPELLKLPERKLRSLAKNKKLADYSRYFEKLLRLKPHVLSKPEEKILAQSSVLAYAAYNTYSTFYNTEMEFPKIKDADGNDVQLSIPMYVKYRADMNRDVRREVFHSFWGTFKHYRNTFANLLGSQVKYYEYNAKARHYKSALEAALYPKAIPVEYYTNLIKNVRSTLPAFHEYLKLRKELLGIKGDMEYYDIYPPLVTTKPRDYTYEEAAETVKKALAPLGPEYVKLLNEALKPGSGWIDVYPNKGKRSGAYMDSLYGYHPFVLHNFNGDFEGVSTLAHELGHAMHSWFSNKTQPYPKSHYVIFNAEVASIFNETLLIEYMLSHEKDPNVRRFLLSHYLDSFRGTVYRQTMFAEFEYDMYKAYEEGSPITADLLDSTYLRLLRDYHGHDKGVMKIDDLYSVEWAYIPHFYYFFYVYSYVNGFIAATALAHKVLEGGDAAAKKYIEGLLKAGGSKDPLQILKDAGVDMMSPEPFKLAADTFRKRVEELRKLAKTTK